MIKKFIFATISVIAVVSNSHALDIESYCSDMRKANDYSSEWQVRCINTLKVKEKYERIAEFEERKKNNDRFKFNNLKMRTDLYFEIREIEEGLNKINPDSNKVLSIMYKMKQICELTVPEKRNDEDYCQIESFKPYENILKIAEGKK